jgi:hypothetical protein
MTEIYERRRMRWAGHVARMGTGEVCTGFWWGNVRESLPRVTWEDNIKFDLHDVGCGGMDWIELTQERDSWRAPVNAVMNLWVLSNAGIFLTSCKPVSFAKRTVLYGVSK